MKLTGAHHGCQLLVVVNLLPKMMIDAIIIHQLMPQVRAHIGRVNVCCDHFMFPYILRVKHQAFIQLSQLLPEALRQVDILHADGILKQWGDLVGRESGDAAAYRGDEERQLGMSLGIVDKLIDVGTDRLHAALHGRDSIALTLRAVAIAHDCTEVEACRACGPAPVHAGEIAAKDKDFVGTE